MSFMLSLGEMMKMPAKDSPLFWGVIAVMGGLVALVAFRDLFLWYFKINELYDRVNTLNEKISELCENGVRVRGGTAADIGVRAQATGAVAVGLVDNDAELAAAIGTARYVAEGGSLASEAEVALAIAVARRRAVA